VLKIILKTFLGLLITGLGFCLAFFYLIKIDDGWTILLLIPALVLIIIGGHLLMRAGKSDATVIKKPDILSSSKDISKEGLAEVFDKNSQLSSKWAKTIEKRDKLKLLQISSAAEDQTQ
jgi:hypothetical protein